MIGNKMTLQFKVNKQTLERLDDNVVVEKSINFLYIKFLFSDEWKGLTKYAVFNGVDIDNPYRLPINKDGVVKVPYDLITFPGFVITVQGVKDVGFRITAETRMVDVELLDNIEGKDEEEIRYVTSINNTINIHKDGNLLDLGIVNDFEYTPETCTLDLYAFTYNTHDEEGQPIETKTLLSSVVLNSSIVKVDTELEGEETDRNLIFTFQDGKEIVVSIDDFFNDINNAVKDLQDDFDDFKTTPDVKNVFLTKAELNNYSTTKVNSNDIVEVLVDESRSNQDTYYKWVGNQWTYMGGKGPFYTKNDIDTRFQGYTFNEDTIYHNGQSITKGVENIIGGGITEDINVTFGTEGNYKDVLDLSNLTELVDYADNGTNNTQFKNNSELKINLKQGGHFTLTGYSGYSDYNVTINGITGTFTGIYSSPNCLYDQTIIIKSNSSNNYYINMAIYNFVDTTLTDEIKKKVDKEAGKGLSTNDFTDSYKTQIGANQTAITGIKDGANIDSFSDVEAALDLKADKSDTYTKSETDTLLAAKQDTLTFDDEPTENSNNPVKSSGIKSYVDKTINNLKWELGTYDLSVDNDSNVAYQKTIPSSTIDCMINKIGGMSYKSDNLCPTATYNGIMNNTIAKSIDLGNLPQGTYTISFNVIANADNRTFVIYYANNGVIDSANNIVTSLSGTGAKSYTFTLDNSIPYDNIRLGINSGSLNYSIELENLMLNKGSTALPYEPYFDGIRDSAITSVVSKDSNDTTLDTLTIDNNIQALNGYGLGINDTCYNYIDFKNKKFIQKVARVDLGSLNWAKSGDSPEGGFIGVTSLTNKADNTSQNIICQKYDEIVFTQPSSMPNGSVLSYNREHRLYIRDDSYTTAQAFKTAMNGIYLYYELATPVETDISQYITTNKVNVEENGTLTFTNHYNQAIPSDVDYLIEEVKA